MSQNKVEAGKDIDTLVAEKVMGLHKVVEPAGFAPTECDVWRSAAGGKVSEFHPPRYSTDIAAAWKVWEKMKANETLFEAFASHLCVVTGSLEFRQGQQPYSLAMFRMDPLAICRAALNVCGHEIDGR